MTIFKFRVLLEDEDNVYRDIEIKSTYSILEFHQSILIAFSFIDEPESSFFFSDNNWHELDYILTIDQACQSAKNGSILANPIASWVNDPHQRFIYKLKTYRYFIFYIELVKISKEDVKINYPRTVKVMGEPPRPIKPSLEPPPLDIDELETPRKRGRVASGPILLPGINELQEPNAEDLESEDISEFIDEANLMEEIDMEGIETMEIGDSNSRSNSFDEDSEFSNEEDDEAGDMGDFDFDSFSSGGEEY